MQKFPECYVLYEVVDQDDCRVIAVSDIKDADELAQLNIALNKEEKDVSVRYSDAECFGDVTVIRWSYNK